MSGISTLKVHCIFCVDWWISTCARLARDRNIPDFPKELNLWNNNRPPFRGWSVRRVWMVAKRCTSLITRMRTSARVCIYTVRKPSLLCHTAATTKHAALVKPQEHRRIEGVSACALSFLSCIIFDYTQMASRRSSRRIHQRHQAHDTVPTARTQTECPQSTLRLVLPD